MRKPTKAQVERAQKLVSDWRKAYPEINECWTNKKLTKRQQQQAELEESAYRRGRFETEQRYKKELEDKKESERKQILDTKIKVLDAAGQLMQQMSTLVEGVWHIMNNEVK